MNDLKNIEKEEAQPMTKAQLTATEESQCIHALSMMRVPFFFAELLIAIATAIIHSVIIVPFAILMILMIELYKTSNYVSPSKAIFYKGVITRKNTDPMLKTGHTINVQIENNGPKIIDINVFSARIYSTLYEGDTIIFCAQKTRHKIKMHFVIRSEEPMDSENGQIISKEKEAV